MLAWLPEAGLPRKWKKPLTRASGLGKAQVSAGAKARGRAPGPGPLRACPSVATTTPTTPLEGPERALAGEWNSQLKAAPASSHEPAGGVRLDCRLAPSPGRLARLLRSSCPQQSGAITSSEVFTAWLIRSRVRAHDAKVQRIGLAVAQRRGNERLRRSQAQLSHPECGS